jgi:hypothetical protein
MQKSYFLEVLFPNPEHGHIFHSKTPFMSFSVGDTINPCFFNKTLQQLQVTNVEHLLCPDTDKSNNFVHKIIVHTKFNR